MDSQDIKEEPSTLVTNPLDPHEFQRQGYMIVDFLTEYYKNIDKYPVRSQVEPGYLQKRMPKYAPNKAEPIGTILKDVQNDIIPGLSHWQSPNHYAYYPCTTSIDAILGETLAAGFNVVGFHWISSPAATELESIVMDWLANMLNLPKSFTFSSGQGGGGVMMGTTCEAMITTITAARDKLLDQIGRENINRLVVYGSDQTHCSFFKSAKIAGIPSNNFRMVKTSRDHAFALTPDALREAIQFDVKAGLIPFFLCINVGTTSTAAVDPVGALSEVAKDYNMWVHIDAAYAGSACICPEFRHVINGVESVDSFSFNAHKWLLNALVLMDPRFELVVPRTFSLVCFRLSPSAMIHHIKNVLEGERLNELNAELLESINSTGHLYMTHTFVEGIFVLRFAVGSTLTQTCHVIYAWRQIQANADAVLARWVSVTC